MIHHLLPSPALLVKACAPAPSRHQRATRLVFPGVAVKAVFSAAGYLLGLTRLSSAHLSEGLQAGARPIPLLQYPSVLDQSLGWQIPSGSERGPRSARRDHQVPVKGDLAQEHMAGFFNLTMDQTLGSAC